MECKSVKVLICICLCCSALTSISETITALYPHWSCLQTFGMNCSTLKLLKQESITHIIYNACGLVIVIGLFWKVQIVVLVYARVGPSKASVCLCVFVVGLLASPACCNLLVFGFQREVPYHSSQMNQTRTNQAASLLA